MEWAEEFKGDTLENKEAWKKVVPSTVVPALSLVEKPCLCIISFEGWSSTIHLDLSSYTTKKACLSVEQLVEGKICTSHLCQGKKRR